MLLSSIFRYRLYSTVEGACWFVFSNNQYSDCLQASDVEILLGPTQSLGIHMAWLVGCSCPLWSFLKKQLRLVPHDQLYIS